MVGTRSNSSSIDDAQFLEECIHCNLEVNDGDPSIESDECSDWAHLKCSKLPEAALSIMDGQGRCNRWLGFASDAEVQLGKSSRTWWNL